MRIGREPAIQIKTAAQLAAMAEAGQVVARALSAAAAAVAPGVSTAELDAIAAHEIREAGAAPSFLGYHGFPATICACINDEIVHGIPRAARRLRAGDVVSIDCGAVVAGWHADAALTVPVGAGNGRARPADRHLRAGAVAWARRRAPGCPARRHLARGGAVRPGGRAGPAGREVRDRRGLRRARHRQ